VKNCNAKTSIKVDGKMNEHDAGIVGKRYSTAALIFATCAGFALLIAAMPWERFLP